MTDATPLPSPTGPTSSTLTVSPDEWSTIAQTRGLSERRARRRAPADAVSMSLTEREASVVLSMRRAAATPPPEYSAAVAAEQEASARASQGPLLKRIGRFLASLIDPPNFGPYS